MTKIEIQPFLQPFRGEIHVPGSKSISNRVLPLAALCGEQITLQGCLKSEDTEVMREALQIFGVSVEDANEGDLIIKGEYGKFDSSGDLEIQCQNSGTSIRFLSALSLLHEGTVRLDGIERMRKRPIGDLVQVLRELGAEIEHQEQDGYPPIRVVGSGECKGGRVSLSGKSSSQFFTALLLLSPFVKDSLTILVADELVSKPYVQMTIDLLHQFGIEVQRNEEYSLFHVTPKKLSLPSKFLIEGDASSASYPIAIAALTKGTLFVQNIYTSSIQGDTLFAQKVLKKMGAIIDEESQCLHMNMQNEMIPLGQIDMEDMPDVALTAAVLSAYAKGTSQITGLSTLRHKECDRLEALRENLTRMGAMVQIGDDFIEINGNPEALHGAEIETYNDHRVAMCFACLGTVVPGVVILNPDCVNKTYPTFWRELEEWREPKN